MSEFNLEKFIEILTKSNSINDLCIKYFGYANSKVNEKANLIISENNLNTEHFSNHKKVRKYELIKKLCPICDKEFETQKGHKNEKTTCSYTCSNKYFRVGEGNGNWKQDSYRTTCFLYHDPKCLICGEDKIVEVHHYDENKNNNEPDNLIPLCPTHHQYWHSRYKNLILDKVNEYRDNFIKNRVIAP